MPTVYVLAEEIFQTWESMYWKLLDFANIARVIQRISPLIPCWFWAWNKQNFRFYALITLVFSEDCMSISCFVTCVDIDIEHKLYTQNNTLQSIKYSVLFSYVSIFFIWMQFYLTLSSS